MRARTSPRMMSMQGHRFEAVRAATIRGYRFRPGDRIEVTLKPFVDIKDGAEHDGPWGLDDFTPFGWGEYTSRWISMNAMTITAIFY